MKRAGLVLEGGANRGVFTSGALDYLMEQEFYIPYVVGTSAGACNAVDYVSRQPLRTKKCTIITDKKKRYVTIKNTLKTGTLLDMDLIFEKYPNEIFPFDFDTFLNSDMQCEMVVTNCITGKAEYLSEHSSAKRMMDICRVVQYAAGDENRICGRHSLCGRRRCRFHPDHPFPEDGTSEKCNHSDKK